MKMKMIFCCTDLKNCTTKSLFLTLVAMVIGVPTVRREKESYLMDTLQSLLSGMSEDQKKHCMIIIFVAEVS